MAKNDEKTKEEKNKNVEKTIKKLKSRFGDGAIMRLNDDQAEDVEVIPTGSMGLDKALGVGGLPADELPRFTARKHPVRLRWHCISLPKRKSRTVLPPLLTPSMRWIRTTPAVLVLRLMSF